jgi:hypothetical protein
MTDDRLALKELLEKTPDANYLREMIGFAAPAASSVALCVSRTA